MHIPISKGPAKTFRISYSYFFCDIVEIVLSQGGAEDEAIKTNMI